MSDSAQLRSVPPSPPPVWRAAAAFAILIAYCEAFLVRPPRWLPEGFRQWWNAPAREVRRAIRGVLETIVDPPVSGDVQTAVYLGVMAVVVPWIVMSAVGRGRPSDLGLRMPNWLGLRLTFVCIACALPFVWWMARGSGMAAYYLPHLKRSGAASFLSSHVVNMLAEHLLLHGVVLAALRRDLRWPPSVGVGVAGPGALRWLGLRQPTDGASGVQRITRWLGLPDGCGGAVLGSALLFFLVHVGKDTRELVLSLGGGTASAWLAYRANSWLTPFLLHLATAAVTLGLMLLRHGASGSAHVG